MKRLFITTLLLCVVCILANAQFSGKGLGTAEDPYQISTPIHVDEIRNLAGIRDVNLVLTSDIDMTEYITENYGDAGWYPIPDFQGRLNGCGYTISGLSINRPTLDKVGFISTASYASFSNLTLEYTGDIIGGGITGAFVGVTNDCEIKKCGVIAKCIRSEVPSSYIGGFVGSFSIGDIKECICCFREAQNSVSFESRVTIGGLLGACYETNAVDNRVAGRIVNMGPAGGVVGYVNNSKLNNNLFEGSVYGEYYKSDNVGGLFFTHDGYHSSSNSNVIIADTLGITGSYSSAHVYRIGVSALNAEITSPQANRASVTTTLIAEGKELTVEDNKYNGLSTGLSMLKQKSLYANMGWDMENVWSIDNGNSYPRLKWEVEKGLVKPTLTIFNGEEEINEGDIIQFIAEKKTANLPGGISYTYYQCESDEPTIKNTSKMQQEVSVTISSTDYTHLWWGGIDGTESDMSASSETRNIVLAEDASIPLKLHATFADGDFCSYKAYVTVACKDFSKTFAIEFINDNPNRPICPTPGITYLDGELAFSCDCEEKPEYHVSITSPDVQNINIGDDTHLVLDRTYCVEVYATAPSYAPSDTTRLTILWIDVESEQEDGIVELKSIPIQISYSNGFLCLTNVPNGATIEIYNLAGILLYRTIAENDVANIAMQDQNVVIVKVNDKGIKCKL